MTNVQYFSPDQGFSSLPELYSETLNVIQDSVVCDGISIFEPSADGASLEVAATRTFDRDLLEGLELDAGKGIAGRAAAEGRGVIANNVRSDPDFFARLDQAIAETLLAAFALIMIEDLTHGAAEHPLAREDHPGKSFWLETTEEPSDMCVQIGRLGSGAGPIASSLQDWITLA